MIFHGQAILFQAGNYTLPEAFQFIRTFIQADPKNPGLVRPGECTQCAKGEIEALRFSRSNSHGRFYSRNFMQGNFT